MGGAITGKKRVVADPAGADEGLAKERQHDVAATEDQRARPIESIEQRDARGACDALQDRQPQEQKEEKHQRRQSRGSADWDRHLRSHDRLRASAEPQPGGSPEYDRQDLRNGRGAEQNDECRHHCDRGALLVRTQRARHAQYRLRHDGDGNKLQPMKQAGTHRADQRARAIGKENHRDRRRQRKAAPRGQCAAIAGAHEPDGKADLAGCWAGQKLAQRHEVNIGLLVEPFATDDEFLAKIAEMRDRTAEARQPQPQKSEQDFGRVAAMLWRAVHWPSRAFGGIVETFDDARKIGAGLPQLSRGSLTIFHAQATV